MPLESQIEKQVCDYAKLKGCLPLKWVSPGVRGVPDRIFICPNGQTIFIEFKAPGGKLSGHQARMLVKFKERGHKIHVVDSVSDGVKLFIGM